MTRKAIKLVRAGNYAAEIPVELMEEEGGWSPYLSVADAKKLDRARQALRAGDVTTAAQYGRVFELLPLSGERSATFAALHQAILDRRQATFTYGGRYRKVCPHILGHTKGEEKVLAFQFGGDISRDLPPGGEWRCFALSSVSDLKVREGRWYSGDRHRKSQHCVDMVYVDVNNRRTKSTGQKAKRATARV